MIVSKRILFVYRNNKTMNFHDFSITNSCFYFDVECMAI